MVGKVVCLSLSNCEALWVCYCQSSNQLKALKHGHLGGGNELEFNRKTSRINVYIVFSGF
jgi:hypothetical protein